MKLQSKWPLLALAGLSLSSGCGANQNTATSANAASPTETAPATTAPVATDPTQSAPQKTPLRPYRVSQEREGYPPAYLEAAKKFKLAPPDSKTPLPDVARVVLTTSAGPITLELNGKAAPLHVRSFLYLAGKKFYDGTQFHRHADLSGDGQGFIIQGGDPMSKSKATQEFAGLGGPGYEVPLEADNGLKHEKLVIAAARSQDPDSAGSQFYITQGAVAFLDGQYTVFGKVVAGADAALKLKQGDTLRSVQVQSSASKPQSTTKAKPKAN